MTPETDIRQNTDARPAPTGGRRILLIAALGLLPLAVGLARWLGLHAVLGQAAGSAVMVALVLAAQVGIVGWGGVPRPVNTLTLAGLFAAGYMVVAFLLNAPFMRVPEILFGILPITLIQVGWGFLAGLLALWVQRLRGGGRP